MSDTATVTTTAAEWLTAWGTLLTALAALMGLGISIATARHARREARDASEALGLILKPSLDAQITNYHHGREPPIMAAIVRNDSPDRAAVDVVVEVTLMDGSTWHGKADRLEPNPTGVRRSAPQAEFLVRCGPPLERPRTDGTHVETVRALYRDERELLRWQMTWTRTLTITVHAEYTSSSEHQNVSDVRLERTRRGRWRPRQ